MDVVWLNPNASDLIFVSNSAFSDSAESRYVITALLSEKQCLFLTSCTFVCQIYKIESYDMHNSLTLADNIPC